MFVEKRTSGRKTKYYLVHSYRDKTSKVVKLRRFLGTNLTQKELSKRSKNAENFIKQQIDELRTDVFDFTLTEKQITSLNKLNDKIEIQHFSEEQWQQFTQDFIYNTNAIEGSTVLPNEVPQILQKKKATTDEEIETKGVAKAINYIRQTKANLSINLILKLHTLCFEGSKPFAGKLRDVDVCIRDRFGHIIHQGTPHQYVQKELTEMIKWYKKHKSAFKPLTIAAIIHNQFEDIHPFQDGNGRVGRLLLNYILLQNNYPPINILLEDRAEYYRVLQEYQIHDKLRPTLHFLIKQYKKTLKRIR